MSFVADRHRITNCLFRFRQITKIYPCPGAREPVNFLGINRETIMKKLSLCAVSVGGALVCAAVPASFNWSPAKVSLDTAEARIGRPLTATSVAGVGRRVYRRQYRRAAAGAAVGAAAVGGAAAGAAYVGGPAPAYAPGPYVDAPAPAYAPAGPYVGGPAPAYAPGPAVAAAPPYGGPGYGYGPGPYPDAVVVNPVTGRWCRTEANGYQFCWTP
jgi:hypothetical protein